MIFKGKKIVHITPVYPPYAGGIGVAAAMMVEGLQKRGWNVDVITVENANGLQTLKPSNIKTLQPVIKIGNAAVVPQLRSLKGYDVIHLHLPFFGGGEWVLLNKKLKMNNCKLVVQYHHDADADGVKGVFFKTYDKFILPRILKCADTVVVSTMDYARHSRITKYIDSRFIEIPFGVDTKRFSPLPACHSEAAADESPANAGPAFAGDRNASAQDDKVFTILFVGSLDRAHWFKGLDVLLKSLVLLKRSVGEHAAYWPAKWQCLIIGDGGLRSSYEQTAKKLSLSIASHSEPFGPAQDKLREESPAFAGSAGMHQRSFAPAQDDDNADVIFLGKVSHDRLPEYYRNADVFIFPSISRAEAFGLVVLEAMASGLPVIASDLPGVRTLITHPAPSGHPSRGGESTLERGREATGVQWTPRNTEQSEAGCVHSGLTFPVGDPHALAERILELMRDNQLKNQMSTIARKRVLEHYTLDTMIDKIEKLY